MIVNLVKALNNALNIMMERDEKIIVLGEDVGKNGGVFRVTQGLYEKFGEERVIDTPLAESAIIGTSIGLSLAGFMPVPEIQFDGFIFPAIDQIVNHVTRIRVRSRGRFEVRMVIRCPYGGGVRALEHHSDSPEAYFCHMPGIKVLVPSNPFDAKGLLISSLESKDPIIFFEPKRIYRAIKQDIPEEYYKVPIGKARIIKEGKDVTIVSWGSMVRIVEKACSSSSYDCEIIDLRSLKPLDEECIISSVKKTKRLIIVQEAPKNCSLSSEIASTILEKAFFYLKAPIKRVCGYDVVFPLAKLEKYYLPNEKRILEAIDYVMQYK